MKKYFLVLTYLVFLMPDKIYSQEPNIERNGIVFGSYFDQLINSKIDAYYKNIYGIGFNAIFFHKINISKINHFLYAELDIKNNSNNFKYDNNHSGIVNQTKLGMNLMVSLSRKVNEDNEEFIMGAGIYTVSQKRIPDPLSNLDIINDGFGAYYGIVFNAGYTYKINLGDNKLGISYRLFYYPDITFSNSKDCPEFYSFGATIALRYILK